MGLGENLRRLRIDKGLTQGDVSNMSGIGLGQISKLERNKADPALSTIYKLMGALDCSADRLVMDVRKAGLQGMVKEQFERVATLPKRDRELIIEIVDKFCIANGLRSMLDEHKVLIGISGQGSGVEEMLKGEDNM